MELISRTMVDQVRRLTAAGRLAAGERLPSVRQLAEELAINPMTVSKAYNLLEQEGLLERRRGIGMVVREDTRTPEDLIAPSVEVLVQQARQLQLDLEAIKHILAAHWHKEENPS